MKYCPVCSERYDEEIIRFCTKDGTPLVDEVQPRFTSLPSETVDDEDDGFGQETIIRRTPVVPETKPIAYDSQGISERIVIPTSHPAEPQVRPRTTQGFTVPPPPSNTAKTVLLTILGTLGILGLGVGMFWLLQKESPANANVNINANQNTNLNTNLGFDSNFNFNADFNANVNSNLNSNSNLPSNFNLNTNFNTNTNTRPSPPPSPRSSPTPTPARSPSPAPSPAPSAEDTPRPANTRPANALPTPAGTPRIGPRPPPLSNRTPENSNKL